MHDDAKRMFLSGMSLAAIAKQLDTPHSTVKTWKRREQWDSDSKANPDSDSAQNPARVKPGCRPPFKPKNQDAVIHGLFARYLPGETRDIAEQMLNRPQIDILAEQIVLAYAAILRAQKLMYVKDQKDITKEVQSEGDMSTGYMIQMPWDKQATFMQAQARAQSQLANMIKLYDELSRSELSTEEQRARIDQIKANTVRITDGGTDEDERVIIDYGPKSVHRGSGDPEADASLPR